MVEAVEIKQEETTSEKPVVEETKVEEVKRPEGLPDKFKSVQDMAKSYSELESKLGAQDKTYENEKTEPEKKAPAKDTLEIEPDEKTAEKAVESASSPKQVEIKHLRSMKDATPASASSEAINLD